MISDMIKRTPAVWMKSWPSLNREAMRYRAAKDDYQRQVSVFTDKKYKFQVRARKLSF